jgi:hypothetical protein
MRESSEMYLPFSLGADGRILKPSNSNTNNPAIYSGTFVSLVFLLMYPGTVVSASLTEKSLTLVRDASFKKPRWCVYLVSGRLSACHKCFPQLWMRSFSHWLSVFCFFCGGSAGCSSVQSQAASRSWPTITFYCWLFP